MDEIYRRSLFSPRKATDRDRPRARPSAGLADLIPTSPVVPTDPGLANVVFTQGISDGPSLNLERPIGIGLEAIRQAFTGGGGLSDAGPPEGAVSSAGLRGLAPVPRIPDAVDASRTREAGLMSMPALRLLEPVEGSVDPLAPFDPFDTSDPAGRSLGWGGFFNPVEGLDNPLPLPAGVASFGPDPVPPSEPETAAPDTPDSPPPSDPTIPAADPAAGPDPVDQDPPTAVGQAVTSGLAESGPSGAINRALESMGIAPTGSLKERTAELRALMADVLGEDDEDEKEAFWMAMAMAGFSIAAGESPDALQNIGAGLKEGLKYYMQSQQERRKRRDALSSAALDIAVGEQQALEKFRRDVQLQTQRLEANQANLATRQELAETKQEQSRQETAFNTQIAAAMRAERALYQEENLEPMPPEMQAEVLRRLQIAYAKQYPFSPSARAVLAANGALPAPPVVVPTSEDQ